MPSSKLAGNDSISCSRNNDSSVDSPRLIALIPDRPGYDAPLMTAAPVSAAAASTLTGFPQPAEQPPRSLPY